MPFIESDDQIYLKIKETGILGKGQLDFLSYLYRFGPCTTNELIDFIEEERPELDRKSLDLFDRKPAELKLLGVIKNEGKRKCKSTGKSALVLNITNSIPSRKIKITQKAKQIIEGAINSALLAVEVYNKPRTTFRSEAFISLMIIAWTKAFHAYFQSTIGEKYFYKNNEDAIYIDEINKIKKMWGLQTCINKFGNLKEDVRKNIEFFIPLRNMIEHCHVDSKDVDYIIFGECQALLMNFENFLIEYFGDTYSINESLSFALQFSKLRTSKQIEANRELQLPKVKDIVKYIESYRKGLPSTILGSQDYRLKVQLVPVLSNTSASDVSVQFVKLADGHTIDELDLTAIIRDRVVEKEVVGKGTLIHTDVYNRVNEKIGYACLTSHSLNAFNFVFSIKPTKGDKKKPEDTNTTYCEYHQKFKRYQYTNNYVDLLHHLISSKIVEVEDIVSKYKLKRKMDLKTLV